MPFNFTSYVILRACGVPLPPALPASMHVALTVLCGAGESLEIPSRPHVCYKLLNYGDKSLPDGAKCAREDMPFLFKAFESGQTPPHRLQKLHGNARQPTIHEYLDWTCTAADAAVCPLVDLGTESAHWYTHR